MVKLVVLFHIWWTMAYLFLQYADDTLIFFKHYLQHAKNLKLLLSVFEKVSGLN